MGNLTVYNVGNRIMNTYLYPIRNGFVMIDTGYEKSYSKVLKRLEKQGVLPDSIKYIFLTHAHDDHAGFLNEMLNDFSDLKVIANEKAVPVLLKGQNSFIGGCSSIRSFLFCRFMAVFGKSKHLFPKLDKNNIDRIITVSEENSHEIEKLLDGRILFTPGHTTDSISLIKDDIIFCGDSSMNGFPSKKRITVWVENKTEFKNSWNKIIVSGAKNIYPAHGQPFDIKELKNNIHFTDNIKQYSLGNGE